MPSFISIKRLKLVDENHPAARLPRNRLQGNFPHYRTAAFQLRAFPKGVLDAPEFPYPNPPWGSWATEENKKHHATRLDMSLPCVAGLKSLHKKATVRSTVLKRIKTSLVLIFVRGARSDVEGKVLVFSEDGSEKDLKILQGQ